MTPFPRLDGACRRSSGRLTHGPVRATADGAPPAFDVARSPGLPHRMRRARRLPAFAAGVAACLLAVGGICRASTWDQNGHLWLNYVGDHPIGTGPWGVHLEGQFRRADLGEDAQQLLLRPGINYQLTETVAVSGGYAFVETYRYGEFPVAHEFPEHRLWQQVSVRTPFLGLDWSHRLRVEQRWLGSMRLGAGGWDLAGYRYSNRLRYQLRTSIPLTADKSWYVPVWNEVFVNVGGSLGRNDFDQNRFFVGLGRRLARHWRLEAGFMEQTLQQRGGRIWEANHTATIVLFSDAPFGGE